MTSTKEHLDAIRPAAVRMQTERAKERRQLSTAPRRELVPALVDPSPGMASYRLSTLFAPNGSAGLIPGIGPWGLNCVCDSLSASTIFGRKNWHPDLRLGELTMRERRRLVKALLDRPRMGGRRRSREAK